MSLISFIENIQKKPRYIRVRILWAGVVLSAAAVFAFWLWSLSLLLNEHSAGARGDEGLRSLNELKNEMPGIWESLSAGIGNVINAAKDGMGEDSVSATPAAGPIEPEQQVERLPIEENINF